MHPPCHQYRVLLICKIKYLNFSLLKDYSSPFFNFLTEKVPMTTLRKTLLASCLLASSWLTAEEGMWPFNNIPVDTIEENYGVKLEQPWIDHVQRSCLRISLGGSGSFVSPQGLLLTNHHVGKQAIYNLSTEDRDLMGQGFLARSFDEELQCPNMYVDQLLSIQDVTDIVNQSLNQEMSSAEKEKERKSAIRMIKEEAQKRTGLQPEVISLYHGARYHLYLYKRYTDVRLVMAPEQDIAFFGGDADNFEYPRYDLDMCFFRVYEEGQPLETSDYLTWSDGGPKPLEPLFVAGHPGRTERMLSSAHLKFLNEVDYALRLDWLKTRQKDFEAFSSQSAENRRIAAADLFSFENALKVYRNLCSGLSDSTLIQDKEAYEQELYDINGNEPWAKLELALDKARAYYPTYMVLEASSAYSGLYLWAKHLVRLAAESQKPNEERLPEYIDSELPTLKLDLLSEEPTYKKYIS